MNSRPAIVIATVAAMVGLGGCETLPSDDLHGQLEAERSRAAELETSNQALNASLQEREQLIAQMNEELANDSDLLPPGAKAGECYARVYTAPTYEAVTKQVLASEASEEIQVLPAEHGWRTEQVLVKQASTRLEVVPARYEWVEERVMVKEAHEDLEVVPAVYETVTEDILLRPAYSYWKKGRGPIEKIDEMTGEIMCLVEEPAQHRTVSKRVLVSPATTRKISMPAQYDTVRRQVMVEPPRAVEVEIPAEYETVRVNTTVQPAREVRNTTPAEYATLTDRMLVRDGQLEWRPILCETNTTPDVIRRLQSALRDAGYEPGLIDGVVGAKTMAALGAFQVDNGLPSGKLTLESLRRLGVLSQS
jgi:hypothetical protein